MRRDQAYRQTEAERLVANLVRVGTVIDVDTDRARARVQFGGNETTWLVWGQVMAGGAISWAAPDIGEQVVVMSPGGDLKRGIIMMRLYSDVYSAPSSEASEKLIKFGDGAVIRYDEKASKLDVILPDSGTVTISGNAGMTLNAQSGGLTINGDGMVNGSLSVSGNVAAEGDVSDTKSSMQAMRGIFNPHTHPSPGAPPTQKMT